MYRTKYMLTLLMLPLLAVAQIDMSQTKTSQSVNRKQLVISSATNQKQHVINRNDEIKLWTDEIKLAGQFYAASNKQLIIVTEIDTVTINMQSINKLRVYSKTPGKISGMSMMVLGGSGMIFGTFTGIVGTLGLLNQDLSAVVIIFSPLLPVGYGVYSLGKRLYGKTYKLGTDWFID